jgi:hypothetical protein
VQGRVRETLRAWIWEVYGNKNAGLEARKATIADSSSETFQTVSLGTSVNKGIRKGRSPTLDPGP